MFVVYQQRFGSETRGGGGMEFEIGVKVLNLEFGSFGEQIFCNEIFL